MLVDWFAGLLGFVRHSELVGNSSGEGSVAFVAVSGRGTHLANAMDRYSTLDNSSMVLSVWV